MIVIVGEKGTRPNALDKLGHSSNSFLWLNSSDEFLVKNYVHTSIGTVGSGLATIQVGE